MFLPLQRRPHHQHCGDIGIKGELLGRKSEPDSQRSDFLLLSTLLFYKVKCRSKEGHFKIKSLTYMRGFKMFVGNGIKSCTFLSNMLELPCVFTGHSLELGWWWSGALQVIVLCLQVWFPLFSNHVILNKLPSRVSAFSVVKWMW